MAGLLADGRAVAIESRRQFLCNLRSFPAFNLVPFKHEHQFAVLKHSRQTGMKDDSL